MDDLKDIEHKYEAIENAYLKDIERKSGRNVDMIFVTGLVATGIWLAAVLVLFLVAIRAL